MIDEVMELFPSELFGSLEVPNETRIEIAGASAHGNAGGGSEAHAGIDALSIPNCSQADAVAQVSKHDQALRGLRPA